MFYSSALPLLALFNVLFLLIYSFCVCLLFTVTISLLPSQLYPIFSFLLCPRSPSAFRPFCLLCCILSPLHYLSFLPLLMCVSMISCCHLPRYSLSCHFLLLISCSIVFCAWVLFQLTKRDTNFYWSVTPKSELNKKKLKFKGCN